MDENTEHIAPGAALNDPVLRARMDAHRSAVFQGLAARYEVARRLLARYPWQEYAYKAGQWDRRPGLLFERFLDYDTWQHDRDAIQLLDPRSGTPVGELRSHIDLWRFPRKQGRILVAGDPRLIVAYSPAGDGHRRISYAQAVGTETTDVMKIVEDLAPGEMLPRLPGSDQYREQLPYGRPTWYLDCPRRPRRSQGFHWPTRREAKNAPPDPAADARFHALMAVLDAQRERHK